MVYAHAPSLNRRGRGDTSLRLVVVSAVVGALALAGCSSTDDQSQPLTVQVQSTTPAETPTGDAAPSDTPSASPDNGPGSAGDSTTPATKPATTKKAKATSKKTRRVVVTKTVHASTGTPTPVAAAPDLKTVVAAEGTALKAATAVHVVGSVLIEGEKFDADLHLGTNGDGTLTSPDGVIRVRRVGKDIFLNVDAAFFAHNKHPELADAYQGKWMPIDPGDPAYAVLVQVTQVASWTTLAAGVPATKAAAGDTAGGARTIALTGGTGDKGTTVLVPAKGTALPLLVRSADKVDQITFDGWNIAPAAVQAPTALKEEPDDSVVDVPAFATETAAAFAKLWVTTHSKGL